MTKPYIRICKHCGEGLVVSPGDIGVECQHCNTYHKVYWVPEIHIGEKGWK